MGAKPGPNEPFTYSTAIALDNSGNVYTIGDFGGHSRFRPGRGRVRLSNQPFLSVRYLHQKPDASGNFLWARRVGSTGADEGNAIAVDAARNVYFTGAFTGGGRF
ncbi:MAG: hypothetical protein H0X34_14535 [Chthoniobacterales bacterium]|nr:hypothetical protein [Chthoniobacterales bacterium]